VCREPAVIDVRRQNANYCRDHFLRMCRDQVAKAISEFDMLRPGERVLVAVSGGKDSLACWHLLRELGYEADGFVIGLGIGEYSEESTRYAQAFAHERGLTLHYCNLRDEHGFDVPTAAKATRRVPCSACGLSKRHLFDAAAREHGYDVVATGHNLDDEAAVLFGNVLRWQTEYLGRQLPVLPGDHGFPRKVKPLVVLRAHRHRLHRRGMSDGRGQQAPRLQGGAQRDRARVSWLEARLLLRLLEAGVGAVHRRGRIPTERAVHLHPLRRADPGGRVRVLQARRTLERPRTGDPASTSVIP
jgi:hypothetical protein